MKKGDVFIFVILISIFLIPIIFAETTFFEGDYDYRDDFIMANLPEDVIEEIAINPDVEILQIGGGGYFLEEQYNKINRPWPFCHRSVDLRSIAMWEFAKQDIHYKGGLYTCAKTLNIQREGTKHDALDDITNSANVIKELLHRGNFNNINKDW